MIFEYAKSASMIIVVLAVFVPIAVNSVTGTAIPDQLWLFASGILSVLIGVGVDMFARRK